MSDSPTQEWVERHRVITIARTWLRTPYRSHARVKGQGIDCLTIMAEVYHEAGLIPPIVLGHYAPDWHLHRSEERYLNGLLEYTRAVDAPLPGDIVLWRIGRCFSHGAIVTQWPTVIHALMGRNVLEEDAELVSSLTSEKGGTPRQKRFFSYWGR